VKSTIADDRSISIIGAGRLGTALGIALRRVGYRVQLAVTYSSSTARRAALALPGSIGISVEQFAQGNSAEILAESTLILIATPDDVIRRTAQNTAKLLERFPRSRKARVVLHTSGALSSRELQPLKSLRFATGSLHPLVSISDPHSGIAMFRESFFCVEGDKPAVRAAKSIAQALGGKTFTMSAEAKTLYHAAAVMASGDVVALFDIAVAMLQKCGLSRRRSGEVLLRLLKTSIANLDTMNPADALTGPFARGDVRTITKHLQAMKPTDLAVARQVYVALGRHSLDILASRRKQTPSDKQIGKFLSESSAE
jgi:predicted short-subunit dehydrogenase-like oxidoreductase (DUF2520 family)